MKFVQGLLNIWRWFFPTLADVQKRLQKQLEKEDETKRKEFEAFERKIGEARLAFNHDLVDFYALRTNFASFRADLGSNWTEFKMRLKHFIEHDIFAQHRDFLNDFLEKHQNLRELDMTEILFEALDGYVMRAEGYDFEWVCYLDGDMDLEASLMVLGWCRNAISPIIELEPSPLEYCNTHLTRMLEYYSRGMDSEILDPLEINVDFEIELDAAVAMIFEAVKQHNAADHTARLTELVGHLTILEKQNQDIKDLQRLFQHCKEGIEKNKSVLKEMLITYEKGCRAYDDYQRRRFIGPYSPWLQALNGDFTERRINVSELNYEPDNDADLEDDEVDYEIEDAFERGIMDG